MRKEGKNGIGQRENDDLLLVRTTFMLSTLEKC